MLPGKRVAVNGGSCRQNPEAAQSFGIVELRADDELADNATAARVFGDSRLG